METIKLDRASFQSVDLSPVRDELVKIIYTQPFNLPWEWAFIGKTIGILSGIISTLDPDFKIYDGLKPYADRLLKENRMRIVLKYLENIKENAMTMMSLPEKVNDFIENLELGNYKIQVDYSEIHDRIDEVKAFTIRVLSFTVSTALGAGSYLFFINEDSTSGIIFCCLSAAALIVAAAYRTKSVRTMIRKYF